MHSMLTCYHRVASLLHWPPLTTDWCISVWTGETQVWNLVKSLSSAWSARSSWLTRAALARALSPDPTHTLVRSGPGQGMPTQSMLSNPTEVNKISCLKYSILIAYEENKIEGCATPETTSNNNIKCSQHLNGRLGFKGISLCWPFIWKYKCIIWIYLNLFEAFLNLRDLLTHHL